MKKVKSFLCCAVVLIVGLMFQCTIGNSPEMTGGLKLMCTVEGPRTLEPDIDMTPATFDVFGVGPGNKQFQLTFEKTEGEINDLHIGDWTITVNAKNKDGDIIGTGEQAVKIKLRESTVVNIVLSPLDGTGTLDLSIVWNARDVDSPLIEAALVPLSGNSINIDFDMQSSGSAVFVDTSVPEGYYTLITKLYENGPGTASKLLLTGAVEIVRIVKDRTTAGVYDFTKLNKPNGSIQMNLDASALPSLDVTIDDPVTSAFYLAPVVFNAKIDSSSGNCVCAWYVNGESAGVGQTFTLGGYPIGNYRIDVIVQTADGRRGGSATCMIELTNLEFPQKTFTKYYNSPGDDGYWFTADDVMSYYDVESEAVNFWGSLRRIIHYDSGEDGMFLTADDRITGYWMNRTDSKGSLQRGAGADGIWLTADDVFEEWQSWGYAKPNCVNFNNAGPDGQWFTSDDVIGSVETQESDASGGIIRRVLYNDPGPDGTWLTSDDRIGEGGYYGAYFTATYSGELNCWWSWNSFTSYNGPGPDGMWLTTDDKMRDYRIHHFDDNNKFYTLEIIYLDSGTDGVRYTDDDVIGSYCVAENTYFDGRVSNIVLPQPHKAIITPQDGEVLQWVQNPSTGHWYAMINASSWTEAEAKAAGFGGHLATINDEAENAWIVNEFGLSENHYYFCFIGLNRNSVGEAWSWISGEQSSYRNWLDGRPVSDIPETEVALMLLYEYQDVDGNVYPAGLWIDYFKELPYKALIEVVERH